MISLEEIRSTIFTAFKTIHEASSYASVPVNWPNFATVDYEHMPDTVISVALSFGQQIDNYDTTGADVVVVGELLVSYLRKAGTGLTGAAGYTDVLLNGLAFKRLSGVNYRAPRVLSVSPYPGVVGTMNVIKFMA